jgi:nicotinate phosphoribosyltransferase
MNKETFIGTSALKTDLYQITMAAGYFDHQPDTEGTFELFVRDLPPNRGFLIAAGLEQVIEYLTQFHFKKAEIEYLQNLDELKHLPPSFFEHLAALRFTGNVWAIPEGELVFANEPLLRVTAPLIQAQLVETYILSVINFQTMVTTKAARVCLAAKADGVERGVVEFGARRAHGPEAGVMAARGAMIGGCVGTSNLFAGEKLGVPVVGTTAHSWVQAFRNEDEAFESFADTFPGQAVMIIDTYDPYDGAKRALALGDRLKGVRLDSGDLLDQSKSIRRLFDEHGRSDVKIIASGDLDEYRIEDLIKSGAPIDMFGVGTSIVTGQDAPTLGAVYKMVERKPPDGKVCYSMKFSEEKETLPGPKQVFRKADVSGHLEADLIGRDSEQSPAGTRSIIVQVIKGGKRLSSKLRVHEIAEIAKRNLELLSSQHKKLIKPTKYPVGFTLALNNLAKRIRKQKSEVCE